ncbi:uncharacterized protein LOC132755976 [Ruditapes philippinarum]|uniref:uncharacterized protein LOC132755976 n=1 Tax=Ruditapes philippinarum TaxID=129788 RepID=UPI00295B80B9|nr:uncharacterized protein LOC132755976 [Ruditapes philippinarum]
MKDMYFVTFIIAIFVFILNFAVTDAYDTCHPGNDLSLSFHCYGEEEYCCNTDFDCCQRLGTGPILGTVAAICLGLGILAFCICGACRRRNSRQPAVILQPNQRLQVSYIAYDDRAMSNHNVYEQPSAASFHTAQPPPYSSIQGDSSKPPPYSSIYADTNKF